eukprot:m.156882 g.156882  ORF g.156882 m.156882 type:complete len:3776 (-) comp10222_c0_seq1:35-11362(-)
MFESLLTNILNRYLGAYVEGLTQQQLHVAVFQGDVQLENLVLRKDALRKLDLPFDVRAGFLGRLTMKIPWSRLKSESVVISIEDVFVLAAPAPLSEYDAHAEARRVEAHKIDQLAAMDAHPDFLNDENSTAPQSSLVDVILDNIQLVIKNVHVRFEDMISQPEHPFAVGITLDQLSAQATDEQWKPQFVPEQQATAYRLLSISGLSVFWDSEADLLIRHGTVTQQQLIESLTSSDDHEYVLGPVHTTGQLQRNKSDLFSVPRFLLDIELDSLPLVLSESQYRDLSAFRRVLSKRQGEVNRRQRLFERLQRYRPSTRIQSIWSSSGHRRSEVIRDWWRLALEYAIAQRPVGQTLFRIDAQKLNQRRSDRKEYVRLWVKLQTTLEMGREDRQQLDGLQARLSLEDIRYFRTLAHLEITNSPSKLKDARSVKEQRSKAGTTWYSWWFGTTTSNANVAPGQTPAAALADGGPSGKPDASVESPESPGQLALTDEQRQFLFATINYDRSHVHHMPDSYVSSRVKFHLKEGSFTLLGVDHSLGLPSGILQIVVSDLTCDFERRPSAAAFKVDINLSTLLAHDLMTYNTKYPVLVGPRAASASKRERIVSNGATTLDAPSLEEERLLFASLEKNPLDSDANFRIRFDSKPLEVVFNAGILARLLSFMRAKVDDPTAVPTTAESNIDTLEAPPLPSVDLRLSISAPQFFIPNSLTDETTPLVIVDLGKLTVERVPEPQQPSDIAQRKRSNSVNSDGFVTPPSSPDASPNASPALSRARLGSVSEPDVGAADKFSVELSDVQVLSGTSSEDWRTCLTHKTSSSMHLLDRFTIKVMILRSTRPRVDGSINYDVHASLPLLSFHFSERKLSALSTCLHHIHDATLKAGGADRSVALTGQHPLEQAPRRQKRKHLAVKRLAVVRFTIAKVMLTIEASQRVLASLEVRQVAMELIQRPYDRTIRLGVRDFSATDHSMPSDSEFHRLIFVEAGASEDAEADGHFIHICYTNIFAQAPAWQKLGRYNGLPHLQQEFPVQFHLPTPVRQDDSILRAVPPHVLSLAVGSIHVNVNRRTIVSLLEFGKTVAPPSRLDDAGDNDAPGTPLKRTGEDEGGNQDSGASTDEASAASVQASPDIQRKYKLLVQIEQLSCSLVKQTARMADIAVGGLTVRVDQLQDSLCMTGRLGNVAITDCTHAGAFFREVFTTSSGYVLSFEVLKRSPRPNSSDPFHTRLRLKMATVRYVHTNRFVTQLSQYIAQLQQMRAIISRVRRAAAGIIAKARQSEGFFKLDITIERPVLIIPRNSFSEQFIQAEIGHMHLENSLQVAPPPADHVDIEPGVEGQIDSFRIELSDMNLFSARAPSSRSSSPVAKRVRHIVMSNLDDIDDASADDSSSITSVPSFDWSDEDYGQREPLLAKCSMTLEFDRNLSPLRRDLPDKRVSGRISNVEITASHSQYELFMGMLGENLGNEVDLLLADRVLDFEDDEMLQEAAAAGRTGLDSELESELENEVETPCLSPSPGSRGSTIASTVTSPAPSEKDGGSSDGPVALWTKLEVHLILENVTLKLLHDGVAGRDPIPICRWDLIDSSLSYTSFTDGTATDHGSATTIFSKKISAHDTRPSQQKSNKFSEILTPIADASTEPPPQLQITYRSNPKHAKWIIILNKARLVIAPDLILSVKDFFFERGPNQLAPSPELGPIIERNLSKKDDAGDQPNPLSQLRTLDVMLSITDPEFVVLEDNMQRDTNAVVLKFCSVLKFSVNPLTDVLRIQHLDMAMEQLEVYSCRIDREAATALSILDPCKLTVEMERHVDEMEVSSKINVDLSSWRSSSSSAPINTRFSYQDLLLFTAIAARLKQAMAVDRPLLPKTQSRRSQLRKATLAARTKADRLMKMGFVREHCLQALGICHGSIERAALWLCNRHGAPKLPPEEEPQRFPSSLASMTLGAASLTQMPPIDVFAVTVDGIAFRERRNRISEQLMKENEVHAELLAKRASLDEGVEAPVLSARIAQSAKRIASLNEQLIALDTPAGGLRLANGPEHESNMTKSIRYLASFGFAESDCEVALRATEGDHDAAALWLFDNAVPVQYQDGPAAKSASEYSCARPAVASAVARRTSLKSDDDTRDQAIRDATVRMPGLGLLPDDVDDMASHEIDNASPERHVSPLGRLAELRTHVEGLRALEDDDHRILSSSFSVRAAATADDPNEAMPHKHSATELICRADSGLHLCLIDDAEGRDLPLAEFRAQKVDCSAHYSEDGNAKRVTFKGGAFLGVTFYNTRLSAWEHFLEPWKASMIYMYPDMRQGGHHLQIFAEHRLELNLSPTMLQSVRDTVSSWTTDYNKRSQQRPERTPFVPYRLKNGCGLPVSFWRIVGTTRVQSPSVVEDGLEQEFDFSEGRQKMRHVGTHRPIVHKIAIQVEGYEELNPAISVDRVGVFVHMIRPLTPGEGVPTRVVIDISVHNGHKLICVRSALVVKNKLGIPLELRLEFPTKRDQRVVVLPHVLSDAYTAIPIHLTSCVIKMRPHGWGYQWSTTGISWENFSMPASRDRVGLGITCRAIGEVEQRFRACLTVASEPMPKVEEPVPGHTITVVPPLMICNLLPVEFSFRISETELRGDVAAGKSRALYQADIKQELQLCIKLPGFSWSQPAIIHSPRSASSVQTRIELEDSERRCLWLCIKHSQARGSGGARTVSIYAPYWMINETMLPLQYRQMYRSHIAAGQSTQLHVLSRNTPFMFSCDQESLGAGNKCQVSVREASEWSDELAIDVIGRTGMLAIKEESRKGSVPREFKLSVSIERGKGRFGLTKIIKFVPLFSLVNATTIPLLYCQSEVPEKFMKLLPNKSFPFHWPNMHAKQLLALAFESPNPHWSGGFPIAFVGSFHVKLPVGPIHLIKVEIRLREAAFEIVFSASDDTPPFRIDNHALVDVCFHQTGTKATNHVAAGSSKSYAWDDLSKEHSIVAWVQEASYDSSVSYELQKIYHGPPLHYPQYFFIVGPNNLVIGASQNTQGDSVRAILMQHNPKNSFQLWQMTQNGRLCNGAHYFLEIGSDLIVQLRKTSAPSGATSRWKFEQGRLLSTCASSGDVITMEALYDESRSAKQNDILAMKPAGTQLFPRNQNFTREKIPPGSGLLSVRVVAEGSTRVLEIKDDGVSQVAVDDDWLKLSHVTENEPEARRRTEGASTTRLAVDLALPGGVGLSIINSAGVELLYLSGRGIEVRYSMDDKVHSVDIGVNHLQIDNQLHQEARFPVMLHPITAPTRSNVPVIHATIVMSRDASGGTKVFKLLEGEIQSLALCVEEEVLLQLLKFADDCRTSSEAVVAGHALVPEGHDLRWDDSSAEDLRSTCQVILQTERLGNSKGGMFFEAIRISQVVVDVSLLTASDLNSELQEKKQSMGLLSMIMGFEHVIIQLEPFMLEHPSADTTMIRGVVARHYKQEVLRQGYKIVGSIDMLGNPIGMIQTVSSGFRDFYNKSASGNVIGGGMSLAKKVTHGLADSASKLTGSISSGLGRATMDRDYQLARQRSKFAAKDSVSHLRTGVTSLSNSLFEGITGVITQPVRGVQEDGVEGLFSGFVRGLVGVVAKPAAGVFDFASEASAAVRQSASSASKTFDRARFPRAIGPDLVITPYSHEAAAGRNLLLRLNRMNTSERFVAKVRVGVNRCLLLVTSERVMIVDNIPTGGLGVSSEIWYSGLYRSEVQRERTQARNAYIYYLSFVVSVDMVQHVNNKLELSSKRACVLSEPFWSPNCAKTKVQVRCDSREIADEASGYIEFALNFYSERRHRILTSSFYN